MHSFNSAHSAALKRVAASADEASRRLVAAGYEKLSERAEWDLRPGGRYFFTRNASTVVAFAVGTAYRPGNGFHMLGAHTDRCSLKHAIPLEML